MEAEGKRYVNLKGVTIFEKLTRILNQSRRTQALDKISS